VSVGGCRKGPERASTGTATPAATPSTPPAAGTAAPAASSTATGTPAPAAPGAPTAPVPPAPAAHPVPAQLPDVLARVNSEGVRRSDFERLLKNVELNNGPVPPDRRDEILRKVLDELITYTVLKQEAKARKVTVSDAEVETQLNSLRASAKTEANFNKELAARKMTIEQLRADARNELAIARMMSDQVASAAPATDAEAKAFYDQNPNRFKRDEAVRASHILIKVDQGADEATKKQARAKIDAILKRAKAGEDFAALAKENSDDGSASQGGDLNFFPKEQMVPEFSNAAFALKTGEISDVVTSQFGYHIIKVTDRKPAGTVPLQEVNDRVKQFLTEQKKQQQAQAFIAQLREKAKIEVLI